MIRSTLLPQDGSLIQENRDLSETWLTNPGTFCWIDMVDVPTQQEHELLLKLEGHPLAIQDAQRKRHPPKIEFFDENIFILYRGITSVEPGLILEHVQIALFVSDNLLVTRRSAYSFGIDHWWQEPSLIKFMNNPFLLACKIMLDSFGRYLDTILEFEATLTDKEEAMQAAPTDDDMRELVTYKARLRKLRRVFHYHERLAESLLDFTKHSKDKKYHHFVHDVQDLHERADRIGSMLSMFYEICGDLIDGYLSITSHRLNRTMQLLTVVTTIFVPLSFLAGIYGMNFEYIPELNNPNGYFYLLGVMLLIASGGLIIFKWNKWI